MRIKTKPKLIQSYPKLNNDTKNINRFVKKYLCQSNYTQIIFKIF